MSINYIMDNNTKYGLDALKNNSSGINNTAIGAYTSYFNLDASNNTSLGSNAAFYNISGSNNTSLGAGSLCNNTTGSLNTSIGSSALEGPLPAASNGNGNVAIGAQSLYVNQGDLNTAVGTYSAIGLTGGSYNTFLGANASATDQHLNYSTAIGFNSQVSQSNQIMLGGLNSGVYPEVVVPGGITGATGSFNNLYVTNEIQFSNGLSSKIITYDSDGTNTNIYGISLSSYQQNYIVENTNASHAFYAGGNNNNGTKLMNININGITGPTGSFTYLSASQEITSPTGSFTYLSGVTGSFNNLLSLNLYAQPFQRLDVGTISNDTFHLVQNNTNRITLDTGGNINLSGPLIGSTGSFTYLSASQEISAPAGITGSNANFSGQVSASSFTTTSDYRIKENIIPLNNTSYTIDPLNPVTYFNKRTAKQDIGLIAHELQEHIPILVTGEKDDKELQTVNYVGIIPILIKEIQELKTRVKILEKL
jgi:hypothetical protein